MPQFRLAALVSGGTYVGAPQWEWDGWSVFFTAFLAVMFAIGLFVALRSLRSQGEPMIFSLAIFVALSSLVAYGLMAADGSATLHRRPMQYTIEQAFKHCREEFVDSGTKAQIDACARAAYALATGTKLPSEYESGVG